MTQSTINPSPVTIRKAKRDNRDWLYIYLRSNVSKRVETDLDGGEQGLYEYDEQHLRIPIDTDYTIPSDHSVNQTALKRQLRQWLLGHPDARASLKTAVAETVDRDDNASPFDGEPVVDIEPERNWAEALCIVLAPKDVSVIETDVVGEFWRLINIGEHASLWRINARVDLLTELHAELWAMNPAGTHGVLAVVRTLEGRDFLDWAVRDTTGMTTQQALARRDRIADYLDNLGHDTTPLRAATNEDEQMVRIVKALGYTEGQLWQAIQS